MEPDEHVGREGCQLQAHEQHEQVRGLGHQGHAQAEGEQQDVEVRLPPVVVQGGGLRALALLVLVLRGGGGFGVRREPLRGRDGAEDEHQQEQVGHQRAEGVDLQGAAYPPRSRWVEEGEGPGQQRCHEGGEGHPVGQPGVPGRWEPGAPDQDGYPRVRQGDPELGVAHVRDDDYRGQADRHYQLRQQELQVEKVEIKLHHQMTIQLM